VPSSGGPDGPTTKIARKLAGDFQPDVAAGAYTESGAGHHGARSEPALGPGATIVDGRYRLLVFHGGPPGLSSGRRWTWPSTGRWR